MTRSASPHFLPTALAIPGYWTPDQALVVAELLDALQELIWARYGQQLLEARFDRYVAAEPLRHRRSKKQTERNGWINSGKRQANNDDLPF